MKTILFAVGLAAVISGCGEKTPPADEFIRTEVFLNPPVPDQNG